MYIFWFLHQTTTAEFPHIQEEQLYIFWFLHQTTTQFNQFVVGTRLYIFWFLHQTTTANMQSLMNITLYIFWFLHQTTTQGYASSHHRRCISFDSYIKPQLVYLVNIILISCISFDSYIKPQLTSSSYHNPLVVYLLIPTSNHNLQIWAYWFSAHNKHSI